MTEFVDDILWGYLHLQGVSQENAIWYFLDEIRHVPRYGVRTFRGMTGRNELAELGVSRNGIGITTLEPLNRTTSSLKWEHIKDLTYARKTFTIQMLKKSKSVQFIFDNNESAQYLWQFCIQMHSSYIEYWARVKSSPQQPVIHISEPPDILRGTEARYPSSDSPMLNETFPDGSSSSLAPAPLSLLQPSASNQSEPNQLLSHTIDTNRHNQTDVPGGSLTDAFHMTGSTPANTTTLASDPHAYRVNPSLEITGTDTGLGQGMMQPIDATEPNEENLACLFALQDGAQESESGTLVGQWSLRSAADTIDSQMINQGCVTCLPGREWLRPAAGWFQLRSGVTGPSGDGRNTSSTVPSSNIKHTATKEREKSNAGTHRRHHHHHRGQQHGNHHQRQHQQQSDRGQHNKRSAKLTGPSADTSGRGNPHTDSTEVTVTKSAKQAGDLPINVRHMGALLHQPRAPSPTSSIASSDSSSGQPHHHAIVNTRASFCSTTSSSSSSSAVSSRAESACSAASSSDSSNTSSCAAVTAAAGGGGVKSTGKKAVLKQLDCDSGEESCTSTTSSSTSSIHSNLDGTDAIGTTGNGVKKSGLRFTAALCTAAHSIAFKTGTSNSINAASTAATPGLACTPSMGNEINGKGAAQAGQSNALGRKLWNASSTNNGPGSGGGGSGLRPLLTGFSQHHYKPQVQLKRHQAAMDAILQEQQQQQRQATGQSTNIKERRQSDDQKSSSRDRKPPPLNRPLHDLQRWFLEAKQRLPNVWSQTVGGRSMTLQISAPIPNANQSPHAIDSDGEMVTGVGRTHHENDLTNAPRRPGPIGQLAILSTVQPGRLARSSSEACAQQLMGGTKTNTTLHSPTRPDFTNPTTPTEAGPMQGSGLPLAMTANGFVFPPTIHLYPPSPTQTPLSQNSPTDLPHSNDVQWSSPHGITSSSTHAILDRGLPDSTERQQFFRTVPSRPTNSNNEVKNQNKNNSFRPNELPTNVPKLTVSASSELAPTVGPLLQRQGAFRVSTGWNHPPSSLNLTGAEGNRSAITSPGTPNGQHGIISNNSATVEGRSIVNGASHPINESLPIRRPMEGMDSTQIPTPNNLWPIRSNPPIAGRTPNTGINFSQFLAHPTPMMGEGVIASSHPVDGVPTITGLAPDIGMREQTSAMEGGHVSTAPQQFNTLLTTSSSSEQSSSQRTTSNGPLHLLTNSDIHQLLSLTNIKETELAHRLLAEYRQVLMQQQNLHTNSVSTPNLTASQELHMVSSSTAAEDIDEEPVTTAHVVRPTVEGVEHASSSDQQTTESKPKDAKMKKSQPQSTEKSSRNRRQDSKTNPDKTSRSAQKRQRLEKDGNNGKNHHHHQHHHNDRHHRQHQQEHQQEQNHPHHREMPSIDSPDYVNAAAFRGERRSRMERPLSLASSTDMDSNGTFRVLSGLETRASSGLGCSFANLPGPGTSGCGGMTSMDTNMDPIMDPVSSAADATEMLRPFGLRRSTGGGPRPPNTGVSQTGANERNRTDRRVWRETRENSSQLIPLSPLASSSSATTTTTTGGSTRDSSAWSSAAMLDVGQRRTHPHPSPPPQHQPPPPQPVQPISPSPGRSPSARGGEYENVAALTDSQLRVIRGTGLMIDPANYPNAEREIQNRDPNSSRSDTHSSRSRLNAMTTTNNNNSSITDGNVMLGMHGSMSTLDYSSTSVPLRSASMLSSTSSSSTASCATPSSFSQSPDSVGSCTDIYCSNPHANIRTGHGQEASRGDYDDDETNFPMDPPIVTMTPLSHSPLSTVRKGISPPSLIYRPHATLGNNHQDTRHTGRGSKSNHVTNHSPPVPIKSHAKHTCCRTCNGSCSQPHHNHHNHYAQQRKPLIKSSSLRMQSPEKDETITLPHSHAAHEHSSPMGFTKRKALSFDPFLEMTTPTNPDKCHHSQCVHQSSITTTMATGRRINDESCCCLTSDRYHKLSLPEARSRMRRLRRRTRAGRQVRLFTDNQMRNSCYSQSDDEISAIVCCVSDDETLDNSNSPSNPVRRYNRRRMHQPMETTDGLSSTSSYSFSASSLDTQLDELCSHHFDSPDGQGLGHPNHSHHHHHHHHHRGDHQRGKIDQKQLIPHHHQNPRKLVSLEKDHSNCCIHCFHSLEAGERSRRGGSLDPTLSKFHTPGIRRFQPITKPRPQSHQKVNSEQLKYKPLSLSPCACKHNQKTSQDRLHNHGNKKIEGSILYNDTNQPLHTDQCGHSRRIRTDRSNATINSASMIRTTPGPNSTLHRNVLQPMSPHLPSNSHGSKGQHQMRRHEQNQHTHHHHHQTQRALPRGTRSTDQVETTGGKPPVVKRRSQDLVEDANNINNDPDERAPVGMTNVLNGTAILSPSRELGHTKYARQHPLEQHRNAIHQPNRKPENKMTMAITPTVHQHQQKQQQPLGRPVRPRDLSFLQKPNDPSSPTSGMTTNKSPVHSLTEELAIPVDRAGAMISPMQSAGSTPSNPVRAMIQRIEAEQSPTYQNRVLTNTRPTSMQPSSTPYQNTICRPSLLSPGSSSKLPTTQNRQSKQSTPLRDSPFGGQSSEAGGDSFELHTSCPTSAVSSTERRTPDPERASARMTAYSRSPRPSDSIPLLSPQTLSPTSSGVPMVHASSTRIDPFNKGANEFRGNVSSPRTPGFEGILEQQQQYHQQQLPRSGSLEPNDLFIRRPLGYAPIKTVSSVFLTTTTGRRGDSRPEGRNQSSNSGYETVYWTSRKQNGNPRSVTISPSSTRTMNTPPDISLHR